MSDMPHYGYLDANHVYTIEELMQFFGVVQDRTVTDYCRNYGIEIRRFCGKRLVSGRSIIIAIERGPIDGDAPD